MSEDIKAKSLNIENLVDYQKDTVVSREVIKKELGTVTFFAFDKGQGLSEHSAPFDAMVQVIDGEAEITISGNKNIVKKISCETKSLVVVTWFDTVHQGRSQQRQESITSS